MSGQSVISFRRMLIKMNCFRTVVALCTLWVAQARPGHYGAGGSSIQLVGVPDIHNYQHLSYPKFDILDLGTVSHGVIPPKVIKIYKHETIKIPKPYPVKVPHNVPYPVPVAKPYPVPVTKLVKVPHPVPVEIIKKVPVPIEVPKPYPVPTNEHHGSEGGYGGGDLSGHQGLGGGDLSGHQGIGGGGLSGHQGGDFGQGGGFGGYGGEQQQFSPSYGVPDHSGGDQQGYQYNYESNSQFQSSGGYGGESHGQPDQSAGYVAVAQVQDNSHESVSQEGQSQEESSQEQH